MLVVDSSVWIDFFGGARNSAVEALHGFLDEGEVTIVVPDLVLYEVLRGFRHERDLRQAHRLMHNCQIEAAVGPELALAGVAHYRSLRAAGFTVRGPLDVLVGSFCIARDYTLLHRDRDFDAMASLRGLKVWMH